MKLKSFASSLLAAVIVLALSTSLRAQEEKHSRPKLHAGYRGFVLDAPAKQMTFIAKDDYLDVLVTFDAQMKEGRMEKVTATILQHVRVVDLRMPAHPGEDGTIELELNPVEAQYAALALRQGEIHLLLRPGGDNAMKPMEMASFRKLFQ